MAGIMATPFRPALVPFALGAAFVAAMGVQGATPSLVPLQRWPVTNATTSPDIACVGDAIAWRAAWTAHAPAKSVMPDIDFARQVVLVAARPQSLGDRLVWRAGERAGNAWRVRLAVEYAAQEGANERDAGEAGAMFLLPRDDLPIAVELADGDRWNELAHLAAAPLSPQAPLPPVLRMRQLDDCGAKSELVLCAESAAEWRRVREQLVLPAPGLPDDWVDFAHERVFVFAAERNRVYPGFGLSTATEEGVDVLTLRQTAPSGRDPGLRASCIVLALPRRPHQLSLVLRTSAGPAPGKERTLATFPSAQ
jgi:hypothetical protein